MRGFGSLLLEPLHRGVADPAQDGALTAEPAMSIVAITVACLDGAITPADRGLASHVRGALRATGGLVAAFISRLAENNFPVLPLRDDTVLVWIIRFPDDAAHAKHRATLAKSATWSGLQHRLVARRRP